MKHLFKREKKWTLKIQKSKIVILVLNQSSISAVSPIVRFAGDPKTALTRDPLYKTFFSVETIQGSKLFKGRNYTRIK